MSDLPPSRLWWISSADEAVEWSFRIQVILLLFCSKCPRSINKSNSHASDHLTCFIVCSVRFQISPLPFWYSPPFFRVTSPPGLGRHPISPARSRTPLTVSSAQNYFSLFPWATPSPSREVSLANLSQCEFTFLLVWKSPKCGSWKSGILYDLCRL